jgi:transcription-repair coupling factor (superfamily II helicase)
LGLKKIEAGPTSGRLQFTAKTAVEPITIVTMVQKNPSIFRLQNNDQLSFTIAMDTAEQRFAAVNNILQQLLAAV